MADPLCFVILTSDDKKEAVELIWCQIWIFRPWKPIVRHNILSDMLKNNENMMIFEKSANGRQYRVKNVTMGMKIIIYLHI